MAKKTTKKAAVKAPKVDEELEKALERIAELEEEVARLEEDLRRQVSWHQRQARGQG